MHAALLIAAASAGLLLLLLAVPVGVTFRLQGIEAFRGHVMLRWLFGAVRIRIDLPRPGRDRPRAPETTKVAEPRRDRSGRAKAAAALGQPQFRRRLLRFLKDLAHAARFDDVVLRARLGLGDPADTGRLWALLGPLSVAARGLRGPQVSVEPDFVDAALEFDARGRLTLVPLQLVALVVGFALSPPSIRAWRSMGASRA